MWPIRLEPQSELLVLIIGDYVWSTRASQAEECNLATTAPHRTVLMLKEGN